MEDLSGIMTAVAQHRVTYIVKKRFATFPSAASMSLTELSLGRINSLTKLSLCGNNLIIPAKGEFSK
jgi:hypothetical protein